MEFSSLCPARLQDFYPLLAEIEAGSHIDLQREQDRTWFETLVRQHWGSGAQFWGAFLNDEPVGLLGLKIASRISGQKVSAEILDIGVQQSFRRQGLGVKILKFAESLCREQGVYTLGAFTYAADYPVIAFYGKGGFTPVATLPDLHGPEDEGRVYLRKIITPAQEWLASGAI